MYQISLVGFEPRYVDGKQIGWRSTNFRKVKEIRESLRTEQPEEATR